MEKEKEKEVGQAGRDGSLRPEWRESILVRIAPLQCGALRRIHAMLSIHGVQPQKVPGVFRTALVLETKYLLVHIVCGLSGACLPALNGKSARPLSKRTRECLHASSAVAVIPSFSAAQIGPQKCHSSELTVRSLLAAGSLLRSSHGPVQTYHMGKSMSMPKRMEITRNFHHLAANELDPPWLPPTAYSRYDH